MAPDRVAVAHATEEAGEMDAPGPLSQLGAGWLLA